MPHQKIGCCDLSLWRGPAAEAELPAACKHSHVMAAFAFGASTTTPIHAQKVSCMMLLGGIVAKLWGSKEH